MYIYVRYIYMRYIYIYICLKCTAKERLKAQLNSEFDFISLNKQTFKEYLDTHKTLPEVVKHQSRKSVFPLLRHQKSNLYLEE